jgi:polar amino acid transport system ATP-binding protein
VTASSGGHDAAGAAGAASVDRAPVLSLRGVRRAYGDRLVLRGIDLDVAAHEVVALVGASGSGKSTLLRTVNLTEPIDDGVIRLAGDDVSDPRVDADRVRARIGIVFQHYNLFPHLSVLDNVTLAARLVHRMPRAAAQARALELLGSIGLGDLARAYPDRLSGGQQQRVAIVRAIATSPELLLLDEVTSALDPELVGEVLELVRSLADRGTTIVMATHEMAFARDVADRVVFLDDGLIIEDAPAHEFFSAPREARTRAFLTRFLPPEG